ncbi:hypothetical protein D8674_010799 [Pyrus ussuriensis x Pyrus communis]|uniref:Uncharacterized protein n=1 Tax=Pyrus ussuriensis x Pyrus communis TaxID=2448454 RepID=A0A5N5G1H4_9ROSA|nr:hypothetical protein D8674_010799 [Pyrus ussuriensis x Pyrus communis]
MLLISTLFRVLFKGVVSQPNGILNSNHSSTKDFKDIYLLLVGEVLEEIKYNGR